MAAFSNDQDPAFVLGSILGPDSSNNMSSFNEEGTFNSCFSETTLPNNDEYIQEIPLHAQIHETTPLYENSIPFSCISDTSLSTVVVKHDSNSSAMVVDQLLSPRVDQVTQGENRSPMEEKRKNMDRQTDERRTKRGAKKQKKAPEEASSGYVHVRARRGEATDSHSLAERARREKIRIRMKLLQSLVPGCDKMIGKALILDQIIKYVQVLQTQVEFLAAKLASVSPIYDFEVDSDSHTLAQEKTRSLDFQLPAVLESSSTQLTSFPAESSTRIGPNFLLPNQEQTLIINQFQDNTNQLWGTDDSQRLDIVNYFGSDNLSSF
ncbi:hypothetical protein Patl1_17015 [Pistacia atlantica]|uniref:Uncharacterized protein n=1 Tax=Pistacia atlantica TaxID=434234 RepID=A0ACC1B7J9_9ROSI|nr:hypothetical protein Patl1_17015 [Pistacia atlantica]